MQFEAHVQEALLGTPLLTFNEEKPLFVYKPLRTLTLKSGGGARPVMATFNELAFPHVDPAHFKVISLRNSLNLYNAELIAR